VYISSDASCACANGITALQQLRGGGWAQNCAPSSRPGWQRRRARGRGLGARQRSHEGLGKAGRRFLALWRLATQRPAAKSVCPTQLARGRSAAAASTRGVRSWVVRSLTPSSSHPPARLRRRWMRVSDAVAPAPCVASPSRGGCDRQRADRMIARARVPRPGSIPPARSSFAGSMARLALLGLLLLPLAWAQRDDAWVAGTATFYGDVLVGPGPACTCPAAAASASLAARALLRRRRAQDGDPTDPALFNKTLPPGSCGYGEISRKQYPFWSIAGINPSNQMYSRPLRGCGSCVIVQCQERQVRTAARARGKAGTAAERGAGARGCAQPCHAWLRLPRKPAHAPRCAFDGCSLRPAMLPRRCAGSSTTPRPPSS
jgi:hypothetical protein